MLYGTGSRPIDRKPALPFARRAPYGIQCAHHRRKCERERQEASQWQQLNPSRSTTINVDPEAARIFKNASPEQRAKREVKFTLQVLGATQQQLSLEELAREVSRKAQERGLTPEILEEILRDD